VVISVPVYHSAKIAGDSPFARIASLSANILRIVHVFSRRIEGYRLSDLIEPEFKLLTLTSQDEKLVFVQLTDPQKLMISFVGLSSPGDTRDRSRSWR
jgi:hypothetical protein